MERRFSPTEVRAEPHEINGYASVYYDGTPQTEYELWEGARERISPKAFERAIKEKHDTRALFNHDPNYLLGRVSAGTLKLTTDQTGLRYSIAYDANDPDHQRIKAKIARGDLQGSSFAFQVTKQKWTQEGQQAIRTIEDVELIDVGPVVFPAYEKSTTGVRSQAHVNEAQDSYKEWAETQKRLSKLQNL